MNRIKKIGVSTKEFVERHKVGLAISTTTIVCTVLHVQIMRGHNDFLKEHNLFDEYYSGEEF